MSSKKQKDRKILTTNWPNELTYKIRRLTIFESKRKVLSKFFDSFLFKELWPKNVNSAYIVYIHKIRLVTIFESKKKVFNINFVRLLFKELGPNTIYL